MADLSASQPATMAPATTDSLTQLQDCFDQLLTQMFASIRYIDTHHPYGQIEGQSDQSPATTAITQPQPPAAQPTQTLPIHPSSNNNTSDPAQPPPLPPAQTEAEIRFTSRAAFRPTLQELAQDLVLKEQQIEYLIDTLPGIGTSQLSQEARIRELEQELKEVSAERKKWVAVQEDLVGKVEGVIKGVRRV
ncbi:hypothetical protein FKW77_001014 [Venturia effusa]|uniref:Mediator of RNA polymerase II transcription subunit 21 n=1 Tax=Venturia effusa TaxID=50376 RepID=A0A517L4T7_9PEZI|nr:hypothetical protein FKW77_001014 [Venturia effusa]